MFKVYKDRLFWEHLKSKTWPLDTTNTTCMEVVFKTTQDEVAYVIHSIKIKMKKWNLPIIDIQIRKSWARNTIRIQSAEPFCNSLDKGCLSCSQIAMQSDHSVHRESRAKLLRYLNGLRGAMGKKVCREFLIPLHLQCHQYLLLLFLLLSTVL